MARRREDMLTYDTENIIQPYLYEIIRESGIYRRHGME